MNLSQPFLAGGQRSCRVGFRQRQPSSNRRLLLFVVAFLAAAQAAEAQNAISDNPEFDANWDGWYNPPDQISSWEVEDSDGCGQSGHFHAEALAQGSPFYTLAASPACLPVVVGDHVFQQVAYTSTHEVKLYLWFFSDSACALEAGDNFADSSPSPSGSWQLASRESTIPTGVASVRFVAGSFVLSSTPATGFDRAYLGLADRVFSDDFSAGSTCRWSSAAGALEGWR